MQTERDVDFVVSDISMPHMTGPELVKVLAEEHPSLPVLLMGGTLKKKARGR